MWVVLVKRGFLLCRLFEIGVSKVRKTFLTTILIAISILCVQLAQSASVNDLYTVDVPVDSYSPQAFTRAASEGLSQVLVKVSGNSKVMQISTLRGQLQDIDRLLQKYSYNLVDRETKALMLHLEFEPQRIWQLLRKANQPIWGEQRPLVVAWTNIAEIPEAELDMTPLFEEYARERGLPLIIPVLDLLEVRQLNWSEINPVDLDKLQQASQRYGGEATLWGQIQFHGTDRWSSHWILSLEDEYMTWNLSAKSVAQVVEAGVDAVADAIATLNVREKMEDLIILTIDHIESIADYTRITQYLKDLVPVKTVQVLSMSADEVIFRLDLDGSSQSLIRLMTSEPMLIPVANHIDQEQKLHYRLAL